MRHSCRVMAAARQECRAYWGRSAAPTDEIFNKVLILARETPAIKLTFHRIAAGVVFLIAFMVYANTIAPTTSFWDCGEFIAASYTIGVPHPPGAPLYLLIGRLFSLLPTASDIGLRVNLVSALVSALTVMLLFLCIIRLIRAYRGGEESTADRITVYSAALVGSLAFAFSHSFWFNAVEAEVYSVSMFFTALVFYLGLRWLDYTDSAAGDRIILFIFYVIGLSSGVHLLNILALISVTYIIAYTRMKATLPNFVLAGFVGMGIILAIYPGIIQGLPLLIKEFSLTFVVVALVLLGVVAYSMQKRRKRIPALALMSILLVVLGYSTFLLIKIRSGLNPFLDENDPETWARMLSYLNREQYGTESLFMTMFDRKAPFWSYQINKMYIRYFGWQFVDPLRFYGLPFLLGAIGVMHHFYRRGKDAVTVLVLFIMTGLGILLYLNQDDPQPRERDYAYVGSFFAFAIWIGIGAAALFEYAKGWFKQWSPETTALLVGGLCVVAIPLNMLVQNYHSHDRTGNYVAWDYSYNLLNTCEPDAILYTNGDNDTFPLWYLQVVEGVRQDVRVVNLSLLNTGWFIKQIRDKEPRNPLPAKITDQYIDNIIEARDITGLLDRRWQQTRRVSIDGPAPDAPKMVWDMPATLSYPVGPEGRNEFFLRVQDMMILNTIAANRWKRPIYFAVTVSDESLCGLRNNLRDSNRNYLTMDGLAFRLTPTPAPHIDADALARNLLKTYRYRNINDPDVYFDDNIIKLLGNYRQGLIQLAYHYVSQLEAVADFDTTGYELSLDERLERYYDLPRATKALTALDFMEDRIPEALIPIKYDILSVQIGRLYSQLGRPQEMSRRLDTMSGGQQLDPQNAFEFGTYYLSEAASPEKAKELFEISLDQNGSLDNYQRIAATWMQLGGDAEYAAELIDRYLSIDGSRQSKLRIAAQWLALGQTPLALKIYDAMWSADPGDRSAVQGLIECYKQLGDPDRALTLANDWLGTYPSDSAVAKVKRDLLLVTGKD